MSKKFFILLLFLHVGAYGLHATDYTDDANCQGAWGMEYEDTEEDLSANNEDLSESAGDDVTRGTDKVFGSYARSTNVSSEAHLYHADGGSTDIYGADQDLTIVGFGKLTNYEYDSGTIASKWEGAWGPSCSWMFRYDKNNDYMYMAICATTNCSTSATAIGASGDANDGTWHFHAAVYNDTDIRIYLDGALDSNGTDNPKSYTSGVANAGYQFAIGTSFYAQDPNLNTWGGILDDVAIFDRELTSTEISDINTNGLAGSGAPASDFFSSRGIGRGVARGVGR